MRFLGISELLLDSSLVVPELGGVDLQVVGGALQFEQDPDG